MHVKVRAARLWPSLAVGAAVMLIAARVAAQQPAAAPQMSVTLDQAIEMARQHNHALLAARTTIQQNQAQETTANLRPNPVLLGDAQFLPFFSPGSFNGDYLQENAQFDAGASSQGDLLKIKLQLLQFQMDVSSARLARVQALAALRQLLGYESVPENYAVSGALAYQAVRLSQDELKALAFQQRPDLRAARLAVTAAESQRALAIANGKRDVTAQLSYTHVAETNSASLFGNIEIPVFDRNQGEIARTGFAIAQSQELSREQSSMAMTDVTNAYEAVQTSASVVGLYDAGYLKQAQDSLDISQYAYQRGSATLLDFLDAQRTYRATQLAYRQALANSMLALEQLRQAVGTRSLP